MSNNLPKYELSIDPPTSLQALKESVSNGSRFIIFQYCIGIGFVTFRQLSPAILIPSEQFEVVFAQYRKKYNRITLLFGWWSLFGPFRSYQSFQINNSGGMDVTEDVMLNLDEQGLQENLVVIRATQMLFGKPDTMESKAFVKACKELFEQDTTITKIVVGTFLFKHDFGNDADFALGLDARNGISNYKAAFNQRFSQVFRSHINILIIPLNPTSNENLLDYDPDMSAKLLRQGEILMER